MSIFELISIVIIDIIEDQITYVIGFIITYAVFDWMSFV